MTRTGLEEFMRTVVSAQADLPREEGLTGVLVVYNHTFIHLVEVTGEGLPVSPEGS